MVGAGFIGALNASRLLAETPFDNAWLRFWIGDAVGILVTAPLLFAAADATRRSALIALVRRPVALLQASALAATVWLIFEGFGTDPSRHFYLLFLPLIWIAVRFGMNGAIVAIAIVQLGVVLGVHRDAGIPLPVVELQVLMAALTLTGLFLGVMVDERQRAEEGLRRSLRLAAAGEMAGAIAHEVNQPLTAAANYGRSAQMLFERGQGGSDLMREIIDRMLSEADRASEVVRRLRDFSRAGTTRLEVVQPANAVESLMTSGRNSSRIRVLVERHDAEHVRVVVADDGPGVSPAAREDLFEPFVSEKSTGMGLGLAVSRAIAEAHGGTLEVAALEHGEFHLILPCVPNG